MCDIVFEKAGLAGKVNRKSVYAEQGFCRQKD